MAPAVTREMSVIYGSLTVGGTSDYQLDGPVIVRQGYRFAVVGFTVLVAKEGYSEAQFVAAAQAVQAAFRKPEQRLRVVLGSQTWDWNPSDNSGFDAQPEIETARGRLQTGRSAYFDVTIAVALPADLSGDDGLQEATIQIGTTPAGRKSLRITGVYTALSSNSASAQAEASYVALAGTWTTAIGGDWDHVTLEDVSPNKTNKRATFALRTRQLVYDETVSATDDADLREVEFEIEPTIEAPGDASVEAKRFLRIEVAWSCFIDSTKDLQTIYESKVLPRVAAQVRTDAGVSSVALVRSAPRYDQANRRLSLSQTWLAPRGSNLITHRRRYQVETIHGKIITPTWTGDEYSADLDRGHTILTRVTIDARLELNTGITLNKFRPEGAGGGGGIFGFGGKPGDLKILVNGQGDATGGIFGFGGKPGDLKINISGLGQPPTRGGKTAGTQGGGQANHGSDGWEIVREVAWEEPFIIGSGAYAFDMIDKTKLLVERFIQRAANEPTGGLTRGGGSGRQVS